MERPSITDLVFMGAVSRLFTKEDLLDCICSGKILPRGLGSVCSSRDRVTKSRLLSNIYKRMGTGGFRSILMRCYSIPYRALVALGYLEDVKPDGISKFFNKLSKKSMEFFNRLSSKRGEIINREDSGGPIIRLFYTHAQYVRILDDGRIYFRLGPVSYHMWPILVFKNPLRDKCRDVVFFAIRDYIPFVGAIVVRDNEGKKAGFRMGEVDDSFAARLTFCNDGIAELWVPKKIKHTIVYKLLVGLEKIILQKGFISGAINLGELCDKKSILIDILSKLSKDYQLILLTASLNEPRFRLYFALRGTHVDFAPFRLSAKELSDEVIRRLLQQLRGVSGIYELILDRNINIYRLSLRKIREGLKEEYNNVLKKLEELRKKQNLQEDFEKERETLIAKLEELSQGILTCFLQTGVFLIETRMYPNLHLSYISSIDDILRIAIMSAPESVQEITSYIRTTKKEAEQVGT